MRTGRHAFVILGAVLVLALGTIVGWQAAATARLRAEAKELRANLVRDAGRTDHKPTSSDSTGELAALRAEAARLRQEVAAAEDPGAKTRPGQPAASSWTNAGGTTPLAAFQSLLWAATGGEVSELEKWIAFEPGAEAEAGRFLAALPAALRADFPDARRLVATMMAARLPLTIERAELAAETATDSETTALRLRLVRSKGRSGEINLRFRRSAQGWQLLVPPQVIEGYRYLLAGG